jgi:hypothetical protein
MVKPQLVKPQHELVNLDFMCLVRTFAELSLRALYGRII